jgi:peptidyl-prolyl cis-trans isomerase C
MKRILRSTALAIALLSTAALAEDYVMMKVNNQDITSAEAQLMWASLFPDGSAPLLSDIDEKVRQNVLRGLISERLIYAEAVKQGVDNSEEVARQLADMRKKIVIKEFLNQKTADLVKEADIKREYEKLVSGMKNEEELRARHILVAEEKEAEELKEKLDDGEAFEKLASQNSKDPGSAKEGGDLGYFTKGRMVPEFSRAAFALKKGEVSAPVKSPFGWHIIKLEDRRKLAPPTYNEVKKDLEAKLQERALESYAKQLLERSDIKYYDAKGREKAFIKVPTDKTQ